MAGPRYVRRSLFSCKRLGVSELIERPLARDKERGPHRNADVLDAWTEHGKGALEYMATKHPTMFVRLVASLIPRHFEFEPKHPYADLTEEQIEQRIRELSAQIA